MPSSSDVKRLDRKRCLLGRLSVIPNVNNGQEHRDANVKICMDITEESPPSFDIA
jgi:hypothetical protein